MGRLAAATQKSRLGRHAFMLLALAMAGTLLAAAKIAAASVLWPDGWWPPRNGLILQVPLLAVPAVLALTFTVPRLWKIVRETLGDPDGPVDAAVRSRVSEPRFVVPVQAAMWGAGTMVYFVFFTAVPLRTAEMVIPLALAAAAVGILALRQRWRWREAGREDGMQPGRMRRFLRASFTLLVVAAGIAALMVMAARVSRHPDRFGMMAGEMDFGGGVIPAAYANGHGAHHGLGEGDGIEPVSVLDLRGPLDGEPDRRFVLTAEVKEVRLASGAVVRAWTYNGTIPGPELRVRQGELVEVTLTNRNIPDGVTIHWHGLNVPNREDGVAGVTQDAVMPGESYTYRFRVEQKGTYWYHTHQYSYEGVGKGLFGALIVEPRDAEPAETVDITVAAHYWRTEGGRMPVFALGDADTPVRREAAAGERVRLRLINTDGDPVIFRLAGTPFRVAAIDGNDVNEPTDLENVALQAAGGGRFDVVFTMPDAPVLLRAEGFEGGAVEMLLGGDGPRPEIIAGPLFDPASYGSPAPAPMDADGPFDRRFVMEIDSRLGFYDGAFTLSYTINGRLFPETPMFMVEEGDLVEVTIINRSAAHHPMHPHGHHMLVLSRNGRPVAGSPWLTDTLNVGPGETYTVAFRADNPGIWMDHCHNLQHASVGMTMHLAYVGVTTPFEIGRMSVNHPE
jgi:FtsP/CotA-like multicopper oxidase with cupredoxin domain